MKLRGYGISAGNFTLGHYRELLAWGSPGLSALGNSLSLALATACITAALGVFLALTVGDGRSRLRRAVDFISLLPNTVPSIVMIVGLILFWNSPWVGQKIYNTYWMVLLTYVVLFLPFTAQYVNASYRQISKTLFDAAGIGGGSPAYTFRRILLPLVLPGILSGWVMTFIISLRELVASLMILPPGMDNAARFIYGQFEQGSNSAGMAMAVVTMLSSTVALILIDRFIPGRSEGRI